MLKVSKGGTGKAVYAEIGVWREGERIHITSQDGPFHTSVKKGSKQWAGFDKLLRGVGR